MCDDCGRFGVEGVLEKDPYDAHRQIYVWRCAACGKLFSRADAAKLPFSSRREDGGDDAGSNGGDEGYEALGAAIGRLVAEKQTAYGDSFGRSGEVLRVLYPEGIAPGQYDDALAVVRVVDKLFRVAHQKGYGGESPWRDICGYGMLGAARDGKGGAA